jgi:lysophospholipid acyltransferase (LPLAT)-like uncharacterized protein
MRPLKQLSKRFFKSVAGQSIVAWLGWLYARFVFLTSRIEHDTAPETAALLREGKSWLGALWHGRLLIMCHAIRREPTYHVLISGHSDGRLISRLIGFFGAETVVGSSSKGGSQGLRNTLRSLRAGPVVFTPDGPRGPRMRAKAGIVKAAQLSGRPLIAAGISATRVRILKSWDRFMVPLPFGRIVVLWSAPMTIPRQADDAELETLRQKLEEELNRLTAEADRRCRHAGKIMPAEPEAA